MKRVTALLLLSLLAFVGCGRAPRPAAPKMISRDGFPITVTDAQHVSITLPRKPQRILSASPTVTEMLFAIGAGERL